MNHIELSCSYCDAAVVSGRHMVAGESVCKPCYTAERRHQELVRCLKIQPSEPRPSTLYKPRLCIDGDSWCALHGGNLQDGVAGFGYSPAEAYADFDKSWNEKLQKKPEHQKEGS